MERAGRIKLGVIVIVCYVVLTVIINNLNDSGEYKSNIMDGQMKTVVINKEGTEATYKSGETYETVRGDKIIAEIGLPEEKHIKNSSIIMHIYNSVVRLYYKDQLLFQYGDELENKGRMIGGIFVRACIPEEAWGESLRLECDIMEDGAVTEIANVTVIETINSLNYFVDNHETECIVFITVTFLSIAIFAVLIFYGKWNRTARKVMYLAFCCASISLWLISNNGMYHLISDNIWVFSNLEYISLFASPLPILLYLYEEKRERKYGVMYAILAGTYAVLFSLVTLLNYTTREYHYTKWIVVLHFFWGATMLATVIYFGSKKHRNNKNKQAVEQAIIITILAFALEMTCYNIERYTSIRVGNVKAVSALCILTLIVTMWGSFTVRLGESILGKKEKEYLQKIAYLDGLTGISNRTGCYEYFAAMKERKCTCYSVVYMDLNNLKPLNDNYGHDEGDRLICFLGEAVKEQFPVDGFYGRLGGDEFIAIVEEENAKNASEYMEGVRKKFEEANGEKKFPLEVSVAYGITESTKERPLPIMDAIRIADYNMYESKKRYKENK